VGPVDVEDPPPFCTAAALWAVVLCGGATAKMDTTKATSNEANEILCLCMKILLVENL
jgi:hypothetical protein